MCPIYQLSHEDYARAESFLPWNAEKHVYREHIRPTWISGPDGIPTERFWYLCHIPAGKEFVLVDAEPGRRTPAFDHERLAAALSLAAGIEASGNQLPFDIIDLSETSDGLVMEFWAFGKLWRCDLNTYELIEEEKKPASGRVETISPDGRWAISIRENNLWVRKLDNGEEFALTEDGEPYYNYATSPDANMTTITNQRFKREFPPAVVWSPDSKRIITHQLDQRRVREFVLVQAIPDDGSCNAIAHHYRHSFALDQEFPMAEMLVFDLEQRSRVSIQYPPILCIGFTPTESRQVWWSSNGKQIYFIHGPYGSSELHLASVDPLTGQTQRLHSEISDTRAELTPSIFGRPMAIILKDGRELLWYSERSGWGHMYLFDLENGQMIRPVTQGDWMVRFLAHLDEQGRTAYFIAGGREPGVEPYFRHLYRVSLDGGEIKLLTPEPADHQVVFSPSGRYFVDSFGLPDAPRKTVLRQADGKLVCLLEEADFSELHAKGWRWPEPFCFKARDGKTDLYGTVYFPTNFDPSQKYPIIDDIYGGSQIIRVLKSYPQDSITLLDFWMPQAVAELGFIVVTMDGLGTPYRSKEFHDVSFHKGMPDGGGLLDHMAGIRQLAAERPYIDLSRVGIYGQSAGGYNTARALLEYPDFFHVGVSAAGPHDMRGYFVPAKNKTLIEATDNCNLAANLQGHLLLMHGEMDDNVHPVLTIKLVKALIDANKDFDLLILPNINHNCTADPYYIRKLWDYFVRYLAGKTPPSGYRIAAPDRAFVNGMEILPPTVHDEEGTS